MAGAQHEAVLADLLQRHAEPHRRYHTIEHLDSVLRHAHRLLAAHGYGVDRAAVIMAALFHDAIYDPRSATNEADSAELAVRQLTKLDWTSERCADVALLIEATAGHEAATPAEAVLLDADLAVLGGAPTAYTRYVAGVRAEYSFVTVEQWRAGRGEVLRTFLERASIYSTPTMAAEREQQARRNIADELALLDEHL